VESSCERGNEPSVSIKCWELPNGFTTERKDNGRDDNDLWIEVSREGTRRSSLERNCIEKEIVIIGSQKDGHY
jgi:hypothetical protein